MKPVHHLPGSTHQSDAESGLARATEEHLCIHLVGERGADLCEAQRAGAAAVFQLDVEDDLEGLPIARLRARRQLLERPAAVIALDQPVERAVAWLQVER